MQKLINKLKERTTINIFDSNYTLESKTWYITKEEPKSKYIKCELSNSKVLVIIPNDKLIYFGEEIKNLKYNKLEDEKLEYNGQIFNKVGEGHQLISSIEFGDETSVEGECVFEDYECGNNLISLGYLPDKEVNSDIFATYLDISDIKFLN